MRRAGRSRGEVIAELTRALFEASPTPNADLARVYKGYLFARSAGYMQIESGSRAWRGRRSPSLSGYDKIALSVVRAIHFNTNTVIPLSVRNGGAIPELRRTTSSRCRAW